MKRVLIMLMAIVLMPIYVFGQEVTDTLISESNSPLIGNWIIDLRPKPDADGYFQPFVVEAVLENAFTGSFYGSAIENGKLNTNWERLYFAFTTKDQSNEYFHSGYLENGALYGVTYCPDRDFVAPWLGEKK